MPGQGWIVLFGSHVQPERIYADEPVLIAGIEGSGVRTVNQLESYRNLEASSPEGACPGQ